MFAARIELVVLSVVVAGCAVDADLGDGEHDSFLTAGKADDPSSFSPAEAAGVLALVNSASLKELDDVVPLDARAANNIVMDPMASAERRTTFRLTMWSSSMQFRMWGRQRSARCSRMPTPTDMWTRNRPVVA